MIRIGMAQSRVIYLEGTVTGPTEKQATVNFFVDSGATYTLVPWKVWHEIGLEATDSVRCMLADGTEIERKVSECHIALPQGERSTPVLLGEEEDEALLGMVMLEELRLVLNPFTPAVAANAGAPRMKNCFVLFHEPTK